MIDAARGEAGPWCGPRDHWVASLHLDDAATAVVAALAAPVGRATTSPTSRSPGASSPRHWARPWMGRRGCECPSGRPRASVKGMGVLGRSQRVSNRRFRTAIGWAPATGLSGGLARRRPCVRTGACLTRGPPTALSTPKAAPRRRATSECSTVSPAVQVTASAPAMRT
jgi:nucleoside-diphosphate-sugar epimerase